jgi:hypothetical protein
LHFCFVLFSEVTSSWVASSLCRLFSSWVHLFLYLCCSLLHFVVYTVLLVYFICSRAFSSSLLSKPSGNLEYCFSGFLAFLQGQIPTHTGTVWSETFIPVPWSFLTRPGTNSHMHRHSLVLRLLPQFLGAFSQYQVPSHTGKVPLLALTLYFSCLGISWVSPVHFGWPYPVSSL